MFDIRSMYWAIRTDYESQSLTNFYFDRHVYAFLVLPMGYKNSCFIGQTATEITYSQNTMMKFLQYNGWLLNSPNWPFGNISEIIIVYSDDVALFSPNDIPNAVQIHKNVIEFVLYATIMYGFKIGKSKFEPFVTKFKFLGHFFNVEKECTTIPPAKLEHFKNFRSPASTAEALSRLSILSYYRKYIPLFKVLVQPIHDMAMSGTFRWDMKHQLA